MKELSSFALILLALTPVLSAQAPKTSETPTIRAGTEEVLLDVVARDKKGRPVTNLEPGDLEIYDNGVKRKITSFRLVQGGQAVVAAPRTSAPSVAPAAKPLDPLRQIRLVTLIFNRVDLNGRQLARTAALDLLKNQFPQNVYMSVLVLGENIEAIQPFTNNLDMLQKAVERATSGKYSEFISDSARIQQQLQQLIGPSTNGDSAGEQLGNMSTGGGGSGAGGAPDSGLAANQAMAQMMYNTLLLTRSTELAQTGRAAIFGLLDAVRQQYRLPGRKSILFFSSGFGVPQGMEEPFKTVISTANRFNVTFYSIDTAGLSTQSLNQEAVSELRDASAASRANRRAGAKVTPAMAQAADMAIDAGKANTQDTLAELAESTGGFLIANTNDFRSQLRKVSEDIETYYEITYNPGIEIYDGKFRKVEVKSNISNLRLQSRAGYFALPSSLDSSGSILAPYELSLMQALDSKSGPKLFGFQSTGLHFRGVKGESICNLLIDVPLVNIALNQESASARYDGHLAYLALVKNAQGVVVRKLSGDVPLSSRMDQVNVFREGHFIDNQHFPLPSGRYTLETAILDRQNGEISVRKSAFFIPAGESRLGISSVSVVRGVAAKTADTPPDDPFLMAEKLLTPTLSPVDVKRSSPDLSFFTVVYPDPKNTNRPQILMQVSRNGQVLGSGSSSLGEPDAEGRIQYVATLPAAKLPPDSYQLRFVVRQGDESTEESVAFTLE
jgi:VWFA-related protein